MITPVNMLPDKRHLYEKQMMKNWKLARKNHTCQIVGIVISFSDKELNPENEADVLKANEICKLFLKKYYKDHEAVIFLQSDGVGRKLHAHVEISDVSMTDHKACQNELKHVSHVRKFLNDVAAHFIDLDFGKPNNEKLTRTERVKREKAAETRKKNPDKSYEELRDILITEGCYLYKDDLRQKIHQAAEEATNEDDFIQKLKDTGVSVEKKKSKKYGDYYTYDLVDCPVKTKNTKARSYKLGYSFGPEGLSTVWQSKADHTHTAKDDVTGFTAWMEKTGQNYISYDPVNNTISADWVKMDRLHAEYEASQLPDVSTSEEKGEDVIDDILPEFRGQSKHTAKAELEKQKVALEEEMRLEASQNKAAQLAAEELRIRQQAAMARELLGLDITENEKDLREVYYEFLSGI